MPDDGERLFAAVGTSCLWLILQLILSKDGITRFWLHHGLKSRQALTRIIEVSRLLQVILPMLLVGVVTFELASGRRGSGSH